MSPAPPAASRSLFGRSLGKLAAGEAAARALGFISVALLFRRLGPEGYGYFETTVAVLMFSQICVEAGLPVLGAREVARDPVAASDFARRIASVQAALSVAALALLAAAATVLPLAPALRVLLPGFGLGLLAIPFTLTWIFQARDHMGLVAAPKVLRAAVFLGAVGAFVRGPEDLLQLASAEIAGAAAMAAACVVAFRRGGDTLQIEARAARDGHLLREGLPICGSTILWVLRMYLATVYIAAGTGAAAAGIVGATQRIVLVFLGALDAYGLNLFPQLAIASGASRAELRRVLGRSLRVLLLPSLAGAAAVPWVAERVLGLVYGPAGASNAAASVLSVLFWQVPVILCRGHGRFALIALGRQRAELWCSVLGAMALLGLLVPLTSAYGALGAAWAMVGSEVMATFLIWAVLILELRDAGRAPSPGGQGAA